MRAKKKLSKQSWCSECSRWILGDEKAVVKHQTTPQHRKARDIRLGKRK